MLTKEAIFAMLEEADFQEIKIHFPDGLNRFVYPVLKYDQQNPGRPVTPGDIELLIVRTGYDTSYTHDELLQDSNAMDKLAAEFNELNARHPLNPSGLTDEEERQEDERRLRAYFKKHEAEGWTADSADFYAEWYKDIYHTMPVIMPRISA